MEVILILQSDESFSQDRHLGLIHFKQNYSTDS